MRGVTWVAAFPAAIAMIIRKEREELLENIAYNLLELVGVPQGSVGYSDAHVHDVTASWVTFGVAT